MTRTFQEKPVDRFETAAFGEGRLRSAETYAVCHGVNGKMSDLFCADLIFLEKERIHFRLGNIFKADASDVCLKNTGLIAAVDFQKSRIALSYIVFIFI